MVESALTKRCWRGAGSRVRESGSVKGKAMNRLTRLYLAAIALLAVPVSAASQAPARTLAVPPTASWQHAATAMVLPPRAAGLVRGPIVDRTQAEQDVSTEYSDEGSTEVATVYLYQSLLPDTAIWFDRAMAAILLQPRFELAGTSLPAPTAFPRPGAGTAGGLRSAMAGTGGEIRSTALAVVPLGRWLLKIRMSSTRFDSAALDARLTAFIQALRWPAESRPAPAAAPIAPCSSALSFKRAKLVRPDLSQTLIDAALAGVMADRAEEQEEEPGPPPTYCRDAATLPPHGVYRPNAATDRYVIALGDAGIALSVEPSLGALLSDRRARPRIGMALLDRDSRDILPSFDRLPPPEQALKVAMESQPSASVGRSPRRD
jgi:hypothetical protein